MDTLIYFNRFHRHQQPNKQNRFYEKKFSSKKKFFKTKFFFFFFHLLFLDEKSLCFRLHQAKSIERIDRQRKEFRTEFFIRIRNERKSTFETFRRNRTNRSKRRKSTENISQRTSKKIQRNSKEKSNWTRPNRWKSIESIETILFHEENSRRKCFVRWKDFLGNSNEFSKCRKETKRSEENSFRRTKSTNSIEIWKSNRIDSTRIRSGFPKEKIDENVFVRLGSFSSFHLISIDKRRNGNRTTKHFLDRFYSKKCLTMNSIRNGSVFKDFQMKIYENFLIKSNISKMRNYFIKFEFVDKTSIENDVFLLQIRWIQIDQIENESKDFDDRMKFFVNQRLFLLQTIEQLQNEIFFSKQILEQRNSILKEKVSSSSSLFIEFDSILFCSTSSWKIFLKSKFVVKI